MEFLKRLLVLLFLIPFVCGNSQATVVNAEEVGEVRSIWVSCFDYQSAGLVGKSEAAFRANAAAMFSKIKANGCNTVYFHVRPYDDAIYPSKIFKWNKHMVPKKAPSYDPLKILIEESHKQGILFHAWINPYRVTLDKIRNPGKQSTINRIVGGVKEIIQNYDVDGIHFDDYFYPSQSHKQNKKYKSVSAKKRSANVNKMIRSVYQCIKNHDKNISFGISPAGDVSYCRYIGADVKTWLSKSGYVDYVVPQLYWTNRYKMNGKTTKLYSKRLKEWNAMNQNGVPMYIGLALYRAGMKSSTDTGWRKSSTNIANQIKLLRNAGNGGYSLFSYQSLYTKAAKKELTNYRNQIVNH